MLFFFFLLSLCISHFHRVAPYGVHAVYSVHFPWFYDPYFLPILHEIVWIIFTYREYFKILDTRGYSFLTIWLSVVKYHIYCFNELSFSTPSWPFDPFTNPSWLCQPIPYFFKALKKWNLIPDFFKIFPTSGNPVNKRASSHSSGNGGGGSSRILLLFVLFLELAVHAMVCCRMCYI